MKSKEEIEQRISQLQSEKMRRLHMPGAQRLYGEDRHNFIIMTEGAMRALKWVIGEWVLDDER